MDQNLEDITGFREWPWGITLDEVLPTVPAESTCALIPISSVESAKDLLLKYEATLVERSTAAQYLRTEGPIHRYDDVQNINLTIPHLTWYETLFDFPVRTELRFLSIERPIFSQAVIIPKTIYDNYDANLPKEMRLQKTRALLERLCTNYEMIHEILTQKYGRPRRNSHGDPERRYWEAVWDRPSGAVQLRLGGNQCPYDFWISYCPKKHMLVGDTKAKEAFKKL